jgi:hypothetical protein
VCVRVCVSVGVRRLHWSILPLLSFCHCSRLLDPLVTQVLLDLGARFADDDEISNAFVVGAYTLFTHLQTNALLPENKVKELLRRLTDGNVFAIVFRLLRAHALHFEAQHTVFTLLFLLLQFPNMEAHAVSFLLSRLEPPPASTTTASSVAATTTTTATSSACASAAAEPNPTNLAAATLLPSGAVEESHGTQSHTPFVFLVVVAFVLHIFVFFYMY